MKEVQALVRLQSEVTLLMHITQSMENTMPNCFRTFSAITLCLFACTAFTPTTSHAQSSTACAKLAETSQLECIITPVDHPLITNTSPAKTTQLIIGLNENVSDEALFAMLEKQGITLKKQWRNLNAALVELGENAKYQRKSVSVANMEQTRLLLELQSEVQYAEYNAQLTSEAVLQLTNHASAQPQFFSNLTDDFTPNDPEFPNQWGLQMIRAVEGWGITQGDPNVVIAILSSGYNLNHPDLGSSQLWVNEAEATGESGIDDDNNGFVDDINGWDWVTSSNILTDTFGHGTHVAGTIAATTNNEKGISGTGQNVKIMPLRTLDSQGSGYIADVVNALDYTVNVEEVHIIHLSLILPIDSPILADAIAQISQTKLLVVPVGNVSANVYWPAEYPGTIAVAATDSDDMYATFSNYGPEVDLAAPGVDILSTDNESGYIEDTGTSMATAHVSALTALIAGLRPDFALEQIRSTIEDSAVDINADDHPGVDEFIGHGRIDMYQALLDASVGLQINALEQPEDMTFINDTVNFEIQVQTPIINQNSIPIHNAVIQYEVIRESEFVTDTANLLSTGSHVLTNADGKATIKITNLTKPGSYVLQTKVGQASEEFLFQVEQRLWMPFISEER